MLFVAFCTVELLLVEQAGQTHLNGLDSLPFWPNYNYISNGPQARLTVYYKSALLAL